MVPLSLIRLLYYNFGMNEMYSMGLSIHSIGGIALVGVVFLNIFFLRTAKDLRKYKRMMSIFLLPLTATVIGLEIFTGVIMMAAKHLDFTIANIIMIVISVLLIVLEVKRAKSLKYMNPNKERSLQAYKDFGIKLLYIEAAWILVIFIWMWLI